MGQRVCLRQVVRCQESRMRSWTTFNKFYLRQMPALTVFGDKGIIFSCQTEKRSANVLNLIPVAGIRVVLRDTAVAKQGDCQLLIKL